MAFNVLIFIDWFYPAYKAGGPIKSVFHIVESFHKEFNFHIVTSNSDIGEELLEIKNDQWIKEEYYNIIYLSKQRQKIGTYKNIVRELQPKCIYYNNMYSLNFGIKPLWAFKKLKDVKQIVAPRGMLGEGALKLKSTKKQLFLKLAKPLLFNEHLLWHASSEQEKVEIRNAIGKNAKVHIAKNATTKPHKRPIDKISKVKGELKLIFISRISTKKNLLYLIELIVDLKHLPNLSLDIYGPIEDKSYWESCKMLIEADGRINYKGLLKPFEIHNTLHQYDFFILPTLHENFGHAIVEGINAGVPIIISKYTPWQDLEQHNVGFDLDLSDENQWKSVIENLVELDANAYKKMVDSCFDYANQFIVNSTNLAANKKLFSLEE